MSKYGVFSGLYFLLFGLNTETCEVNLRIQSKYGKISTRKNSLFRKFPCCVILPPFLTVSKNTNFPFSQLIVSRSIYCYYFQYWSGLACSHNLHRFRNRSCTINIVNLPETRVVQWTFWIYLKPKFYRDHSESSWNQSCTLTTVNLPETRAVQWT